MPYTKYKELPKSIIREGLTLPCEVLIYLEDGNAPVFFEKGQTVESADLDRLDLFGGGHLIVTRSEYEEHFEALAIAVKK